MALVDEQRVLERAQTDWRRVARWTILLAVVSAALALGIRTTTIIRHRGSACVEVKDKDAGRTHPSPGCERVAALIFRVCAVKPAICFGAAQRELRALTPRQRRAFERSLAALIPNLTTAAPRAPRPSPRRRAQHARPPARRGPTAHAPPRRPSAPPVPTPAPPPAGPSPPSRPTPSDVLNRVKDRARDTANDTTQSVGAGRPVPPLPDLPPTPLLPDVCDLLTPPICP